MPKEAFNIAKSAIAHTTLLWHPIPGAELSVQVDASDITVDGTLMQILQEKQEPIAFFSMKLNKIQQKWSTYARELFSVHSVIKKIQAYVRNFQIYTNLKPLIYAFQLNPNKCLPLQLHHLNYISQHSRLLTFNMCRVLKMLLLMHFHKLKLILSQIEIF